VSTHLSSRDLLRKKNLEQKRRKTITFLLIALAVIVLLGITIFLPNFLSGQAKSGEGRGISLGDPNAPVTVVNFSSYSCGFCANFASSVEPQLIADYIDTGDVYYRYVNIASNSPDLITAAKASYCAADQNRFFDYKSYLYSAVSTPDGLSKSNLINMSSLAGMDQALFEACLDDSKYENAHTEDLKYAQSVGITGTPTFLIDGQLVSSNEVIPLVDSLLKD
jgi:protein-disulfide isomerase